MVTSSEKRSQSALRESELRLRTIFETAVEGIVIIDDKGIMESFNPAAERLFGYRAEEVIGRNVSMLMPSPYHEEHDGYIDNYLGGGEPKIIGIGREVEGLRKDGSTFPTYLAVSEMRLGERRMFTGFIHDISDLKNAMNELEQLNRELEKRVSERTADLEQANEELQRLSFVISHDLRAPLRGIRTYVDFIREDLEGKVGEETAGDLAGLGQAAEELSNMIDEMLAYSRIGRGRSAAEEIDVAQLIQKIGLNLAQGPGYELRIEGELPRLHLSHDLVHQVFQNLIQNGLHYNRSNPRRVEISAASAEGEGRWLFAIRDNGIGIDERDYGKIFEMFQRLHSPREYPGTGIGLAAVRKAVQQLKGSVRLESTPGKGSTFYVELPERE